MTKMCRLPEQRPQGAREQSGHASVELKSPLRHAGEREMPEENAALLRDGGWRRYHRRGDIAEPLDAVVQPGQALLYMPVIPILETKAGEFQGV